MDDSLVVIYHTLIELIKNMSVLIVLAYILTRTRLYAAILLQGKATLKQQVCLALICGLFSIFGTSSGIPIGDAVANISDLGPAVAGLIGGPAAGLAAGLIGGLYRFFGASLTFSSAVSTVIAGLAGGLVRKLKKGRFIGVGAGAALMALVEILHMGLILAMERPFSLALLAVAQVAGPMIATAALGMAVFVFIVRNYLKEKETQRTKELIESELSVAREIQMSIVPKIFPPFPDRPELDIFAALEPAKEVGGDLYDFFLLDADHLCFTVGDVSGKGVPASLFMAVTKTLLKAKADISLRPDEILYQVNNDLCRDNDSGMFVTVFLGILNLASGDVVFSNGGHNIPFIVRRDGAVELLPRIPGLALGVMEEAKFTCSGIRLQAGDSLLVYTDGVTEAMNPAGDLLGEERLQNILRQADGGTAKGEVQQVLAQTREFAGGAVQSDDITILALKYLQPAQREFRIKNRLDEISALTAKIDEFLAAHRLPQQTAFQIDLVLDEILTNTINYGYQDSGEQEIIIKLVVSDATLTVEIEDGGLPFNPLERPEPDLTQSIEARPIGGLGIHLVRQTMDAVDYRREADRNRLTIKKHRTR
jgi:sigma-B regulation protein RsbU (phosphoserine phosphatase)